MKKSIWITTLILLIITIIGLILFYDFNSNINKKGDNEVTIEDFNEFIRDNKLFYFDIINQNFQANELTDNQINKYLYQVYKDYFKNTNNKELTKEEVDNYLINIFGSNLNYQHKDLYCNECQKYHILYDKEKQIYYENTSEKINHDSRIMRVFNIYLTKAENKYVISLKCVYISVDKDNNYKGLYGSYTDALNDKNIIYDISYMKEQKEDLVKVAGQKIEEFESQLNEYKYTFKVEDGIIYLDSFDIKN